MTSKSGTPAPGGGASLLGLGVIFLALGGVTGRHAFLGVGAAFLIGGLAFLVRYGRAGRSK